MFVGHFAAGFAGKVAAPRVNLGWMLLAATLLDVSWVVFLLTGVEHARIVPGLSPASPLELYDYPWSHSLALATAWAIVAGGAWWAWKRDARGATVLGLVVLSHWVLDLVSHLPDLPLWPGESPKVGLGLWQSIPATVVVEGGLWVAAVALYARVTRARDGVGRYGLGSFAVVLTLLYAMSFMGPPPPDVRVLAWTNVTTLVFLVWPAWFDRHREAKGSVAAPAPARVEAKAQVARPRG